jgi:hypothetical protein
MTPKLHYLLPKSIALKSRRLVHLKSDPRYSRWHGLRDVRSGYPSGIKDRSHPVVLLSSPNDRSIASVESVGIPLVKVDRSIVSARFIYIGYLHGLSAQFIVQFNQLD